MGRLGCSPFRRNKNRKKENGTKGSLPSDVVNDDEKQKLLVNNSLERNEKENSSPPNICVQCGYQSSPDKLNAVICENETDGHIPEDLKCQESVLKQDFECQVSIEPEVRAMEESTSIDNNNTTKDSKPSLPSTEETESAMSAAARKRSALLSVVKSVSPRAKFRVEDVVGDDGSLLNAAAVRKLLQKPTVNSYTSFLICLKKGSMKFIEGIIQECDAFQLMFDALAALSLKTIGSFTDTILQLEISRDN